jgi:hypothetical protein
MFIEIIITLDFKDVDWEQYFDKQTKKWASSKF